MPEPEGGRSWAGSGNLAGPRLLAVLAVTWVMVVVTAFYAVHKPAGPAQLTAIARLLVTSVGLLGTLSLAQALGRLWGRWLGDLGARARWALELGLGLATLGYLTLVLGALRAYRPALAWGLIVLSLPFGLRRLASGVRK